jgi:group I intron endonuclease
MKYVIYCIKNELNGKVYIGYTGKNIDKRFNTHIKNAKEKINRKLYDSMNKYGCNNFTISKLDETDSIESAQELESWYIHIFKSKNSKYGYNMTNGGDGGYTLSEWDEIDKQNLYTQQKQKREETLMNRYGVNSASKLNWVKEKISNSHKGKKLSEEHRKSISTTIKEKVKNGDIVINTNGLKLGHIKGEFNHSDNTKEKISKARLGKRYEDIFDEDTVERLKKQRRISFTGKNNPLYVENLNIDEQKEFIKFLIENKTLSFCEKYFNKSVFKLRQLLRQYGVDNIQKLKNTDKENNFLNEILKKL